MDMLNPDNSRSDPLDLRHFTKVIELEHAAIMEVARQNGIRRDEPFGLLLSTILQTQRRSAEASIATVAELSRIAANAQLASDGDVLRRRQIQKETGDMNAELRRSITAVVDAAQEERRSLHDNFLDQMVPKLSKSLEKCLVIRERRHNRVSRVSEAMMVAGVVTAVFLAGFAVSLWADWRGSARLDELEVAISRCVVGAPIADADGSRYCLLNSFLPKGESLPPVAGSKTRSR